MRMINKNFTTISIPSRLFQRIKKDIKSTGFNSVSNFATFVLRELTLSKKKGDFSSKEIKKIKEKLRELGYLE